MKYLPIVVLALFMVFVASALSADTAKSAVSHQVLVAQATGSGSHGTSGYSSSRNTSGNQGMRSTSRTRSSYSRRSNTYGRGTTYSRRHARTMGTSRYSRTHRYSRTGMYGRGMGLPRTGADLSLLYLAGFGLSGAGMLLRKFRK